MVGLASIGFGDAGAPGLELAAAHDALLLVYTAMELGDPSAIETAQRSLWRSLGLNPLSLTLQVHVHLYLFKSKRVGRLCGFVDERVDHQS